MRSNIWPLAFAFAFGTCGCAGDVGVGSERPRSEGGEAMLTDPPEPEAINDETASVVNALEPEVESSEVEPSLSLEEDSSSEESDELEIEGEEFE
jgi:hypothetical protein